MITCSLDSRACFSVELFHASVRLDILRSVSAVGQLFCVVYDGAYRRQLLNCRSNSLLCLNRSTAFPPRRIST